MNALPSSHDQVHQIIELLNRHHLVELLVHRQDSRKQDLVESLVHRQHLAELQNRLDRLHPADAAYLLETLPRDQRLLIWQQLPREKHGAVILEASESVREALLRALPHTELRELVRQLSSDDLPDVADDIPEDVLQEAIGYLATQEERYWLQQSLTYEKDSVGHLMSRDVIRVRDTMTIEDAIHLIRQQPDLPRHTNKLFVVDAQHHLKGELFLKDIIRHVPSARVEDVMVTPLVTFQPHGEGREAVHAFTRYDLVSAAVVDERQRLVGRLTIDVIMDFTQQESHEEALNTAGLSGSEDLFAPVWESARNRWVWLAINLMTAFLASRVISLFAETIEQLVALATLMPIVAGIGGNTGNQTIALIVRGLALEQIHAGNTHPLVFKELGVSLLNGIVWGTVMGLITYALYQNIELGFVMTLAMLMNMLIAAAVGMAVPLVLNRFGRDPALGSSVLLTFTTDSMGFFIFLGLATLFLM